MYVGKEYLSEKDTDKRKALIETELEKVDQFRFENALIDNEDKSNTRILNKLKTLNITQKQALIGRLGQQQFIENKEMQKTIAQMIPSTGVTTGAVFTAEGGYEVQFQNIKIVVKPDVSNSGKPKRTTDAVTEMTPQNPDELLRHSGTPGFGFKGKKITEVGPTQVPQLVYEIITYYGTDSGPDKASGYGVGTRPEDTGENKTLRAHEGSHGTSFINFIRDNITKHPFPVFDGKVGDTKDQFMDKRKDYQARVKAFSKMLSDAGDTQIQEADCVGKTIEQYSTEHEEVSEVKCKKRK
jgi:hypothetical protein